MAYGQTGSGKTYTVCGPAIDNYPDRGTVTRSITRTFTYPFISGLALRTVGFLFERIRNLTSKTSSVTIRLSALEIYNEKITDLLKDIASNPNLLIHPSTFEQKEDTGNAYGHNLAIVDTVNGVMVPSLYIVPVTSEEDTYSLLLEAFSSRVVREHQLNKRSNRSHVIYTFYINKVSPF